MPGPVFLRGERVTLHPVEEADLEFLQECVNHPRVRQGIGSYAPYNRRQEREWFEELGDDEAVFVVCADDDPAGVVGLHDVDGTFGTAEVGYYLHPEAWGNGYMTDAVHQVVGYAFTERRLHRVSARCFAHNDASRRVLERVGFEREGVHREAAFVDGDYVDVYYYGLLDREWEDGDGDGDGDDK